MRDSNTNLAMVAVALYVVIAVLATPALASPASAGPAMFRGWQLDGTGLFVLGESGRIEPTEWTVPVARGWDETTAASGYEDQITELDRDNDLEVRDSSAWCGGPETREWDERAQDDGALSGWWGESEDDARADDRYHAYADGGEM